MIVLANGCFDILHIGHVLHLQEAKAMGDTLVVSITKDAYVNKGPGRPVYSWCERAAVVNALRCVDRVIACSSAIEAIHMVKPDIFVKGIDYAGHNQWTEKVEDACKKIGAIVRFTKSPKMSATETIKRVYDISRSEVQS